MIKMIIAPLIFSTLIVGIAGHGNVRHLGQIGLKTIVYFEVVTTLALAIGLGVANYFHPGHGFNVTASAHNIAIVEQMGHVNVNNSVVDTFLHMVPNSIVDAMAKGDILQIVFFSVFFAVALASIGDKGKPILNVLSSLADIMFKVTEYVMLFAPIGVFAAISSTIGENGIGVLGIYAKLIGTLYLALFLFVGLVLVVACKICKIPFMGLLKALQEPALLAFSTASSEAALPKAMKVMENFGVPRNIVGFVMPTGYTFNLDGSTLYLSMAVVFVAQASGITLDLYHQLMIMLTLMLTSKGIAAVPRVSLIVLTATLASFNLPIAGVAILLGIDQILDMGRTTVNLIGNCVASTVIAKWEKVFDYNKMCEYLEISNIKISPKYQNIRFLYNQEEISKIG
jgi:proton glutamate symport protein